MYTSMGIDRNHGVTWLRVMYVKGKLFCVCLLFGGDGDGDGGENESVGIEGTVD